jgi:hypothetical protein
VLPKVGLGKSENLASRPELRLRVSAERLGGGQRERVKSPRAPCENLQWLHSRPHPHTPSVAAHPAYRCGHTPGEGVRHPEVGARKGRRVCAHPGGARGVCAQKAKEAQGRVGCRPISLLMHRRGPYPHMNHAGLAPEDMHPLPNHRACVTVRKFGQSPDSSPQSPLKQSPPGHSTQQPSEWTPHFPKTATSSSSMVPDTGTPSGGLPGHTCDQARYVPMTWPSDIQPGWDWKSLFDDSALIG